MKYRKRFPEIRGNLGFGCLRLPMKGDDVDYDEFCRMADAEGIRRPVRRVGNSVRKHRQPRRTCCPIP